MRTKIIVGVITVVVVIGIIAAVASPAEDETPAPAPAVATATAEPTSTPSPTPTTAPATATPTAAPTTTPSPTPEPTPTTPTPEPTPEPTPNVRECFSPWDGNLDALEDLVRPLLNDEDSMETHETRFSIEPDADGYHTVVMEYSAKNALGGRVKVVATGKVHAATCETVLIDPGF